MDKTALITGASRGIGKNLSYLFAKDRINLVLVARDQASLQTIAADLKQQFSIQVTVISLDLTLPTAVKDLVSQLNTQKIQIDYLINNAGFGWSGRFQEMPDEKIMQMIQLNITTLASLTWALLPNMLLQKHGKILNLASMAAFFPGPNMAIYYATKAFVLSFSQALAEEVKSQGITVTALCPGPTATDFMEVAHLKNALLGKGIMGLMPPQKVAQIAYRAFWQGKSVRITGWLNNLLVKSSYFLPTRFVLKVIARIHAHS